MIQDDASIALASMAEFAERLADAAREQTVERWATGCLAEGKESAAGFDPVTEADREAERAMRALIEAEFPAHGISGEEFPDRAAQCPYGWSLDPVDGTRSFICRLPTWVTLIGLLQGGRPVLGLIDAPCLGERYIGFGSHGRLTLADGRTQPLSVSKCTRIEDARLSTTDPYLFEGAEANGFERVRRSAQTTRYGQDGYAYARLAGGTIDLVIETALKPHDYNALIPVVRAAGGMIGDWSGGNDFSDGKVVAAATEELYRQAIEILAS